MRLPRIFYTLPLVATGLSLLLGAAFVAPASATMMISFTGNAGFSIRGNPDPVFTPISGTFLFDPALGTTTYGSIHATWRGPIAASIRVGDNVYAFTNDGQVQLKDNFPRNLNDRTDDPDYNDYVRVIVSQTVPIGPDMVHGDSIFFFAEEFHQDFIHGFDFTQQSFDIQHTCCDDGMNRFADGDRFVSSYRVQPGYIDSQGFSATEVAMHEVPVPEPRTLLMLITALGALVLLGARRRFHGAPARAVAGMALFAAGIGSSAPAGAAAIVNFTGIVEAGAALTIGTSSTSIGGESFSGSFYINTALGTAGPGGAMLGGGLGFIVPTVNLHGYIFTFAADANREFIIDNLPVTKADVDSIDRIQVQATSNSPQQLLRTDVTTWTDTIHGVSIEQQIDIVFDAPETGDTPSAFRYAGADAQTHFQFGITEFHVRPITDTHPVPEPMTLPILVVGLLGLAAARRQYED